MLKVRLDPWIFFITLSLIAFGLLMVTSASMVISDRNYGFPLHYFYRQLVFVGLGVALAVIATQVPMWFWQKISLILLLVGVVMLALVLIPGIGKVVNGSRRWFAMSFFSIQVSEIIKLCALLYLARYLQRFHDQVQTQFIGFIRPIIILSLIVVLLLLEPDFGAAAVITMTFFALLFLAGARLYPFMLLLLIGIAFFALLAIVTPYRLERITSFLNPWQTAYSSGYQLTQSLIAFGRGGIFGVGLGNGIQKLFYLPEAHTDFIFAVIGEELGLIGELVLILLYVLLLMRIIAVGRRAYFRDNLFAAFLAYGIGVWLTLQTIINIGVSSGVLPTKGLTLPFISSGGSSLLINCLVIGIVLRIAHENEQLTGPRYGAK